MKIKRNQAKFRPIIITLERQEEFENLVHVLNDVLNEYKDTLPEVFNGVDEYKEKYRYMKSKQSFAKDLLKMIKGI